MKPAIQHLKEAFPDWKDWPEGSVDAQVKVMQDYAREVAEEVAVDMMTIASRYIEHRYGQFEEKAEDYKIQTP